MPSIQSVNLAAALESVDAFWQPQVVAQFNGHDVMVVKVRGEFTWHAHDGTDDFFQVLKGRVVIDLPDGAVTLQAGEMFVVPMGILHRPRADEEAHLLLIEPAGTPNTGDPRTAAPRRVAPQRR